MKKILTSQFLIVTCLLSAFLISCSDDDDSGEMTNTNLPEIITLEVQGINGINAVLGGNIISSGGSDIYERGVCWSASGIPSPYDGNYIEDYTNQIGIFNLTTSNQLEPNTQYNIRAYFRNQEGIYFGQVVTFTTGSSVTTLNPTEILTTKALLKGYIEQESSETSEVGFVYNTLPNPNINNMSTSTFVYGASDFEREISNLSYNTTYYIRSYKRINAYPNDIYHYGEEKQFKTTGYTGTAGGYVAYDMGEDNQGWRYLEIHPVSLQHSSSYGSGSSWGTSGFISGLSDQFGAGPNNTQIIDNTIITSNCAAKLVNNLSLNGYSDWFLPSKDEALLIANSLKEANIIIEGGWTSSQYNSSYAYFYYYNGSVFTATTNTKDYYAKALPVRRYL